MKARGTSVNRNRVKRQIREAFRIQAPLLGSFDYNVVIPGSKKLNFIYADRLRKCLNEQLPRAFHD